MRYTIGQQYIFVHQQIQRTGRRHFFMPMAFHPWRDTLEKIRVIVLTCTEHHKVPNHWDKENKLECDGFIFADDKGGRWLNQYPRASYGQMSDNADGYVHFDWPDSTELNDIDEEDERGFTFEAFDRSASTLLRGIKTFKKELINCENPTDQDRIDYSPACLEERKLEYKEMRDALETHLQLLIAEVVTKTGVTVDVRPCQFENTDGTFESHPDILHTYVKWPNGVEI